jgi:hypothetical protein
MYASLACASLATILGLLGWGCGQEFTSNGQGGSPTTTSTHSTGGHTTTSLGGGGATGLTGGGGAGLVGGTGGGAATGGAGNGQPGGSGGTGNVGGSGGAGGAPSCNHSVCDVGPPLAAECGTCEGMVCANQDNCCSTTWGALCVLRAVGLCGVTCPAACGNIFSDVAGYALCDAHGASCTFHTSGQQTCSQVCSSHGAICTEAWAAGADCASIGADIDCTASSAGPNICDCAVP